MMKTKYIRLISALMLPIAALTSFCITASARNTQKNELHITTAEEFIQFADDCHTDSYSENLTVYLDNNINLGGYTTEGVPIFCGTFDGQGHSILQRNVEFNGEYSGLFRYITEGATVENLKVTGLVKPDGTADYVGGIAGENSGSIINCAFSGIAAGNDYVGLICGRNKATGTVTDCKSSGQVSGSHYTGGICGINLGVVTGCENSAVTNSTRDSNEVNLSEITVSDIGATESLTTVTDIGGIAGRNEGVIRNCTNTADIGYIHIGYNIGGIAGSNSGLITRCENSGDINARKEAGGIAGQMEPYSHVTYSEDYLQKIRKECSAINSTVSKMVKNAKSYTDAARAEYTAIESKSQDAVDIIDSLIKGKAADASSDSITAMSDALTNDLKSILSSYAGIKASAKSETDTALRDADTLNDQIETLTDTVNDLANLTISADDIISDSSTEKLKTEESGKVMFSRNSGDVYADINAGGISGAMAFENDLDQEDDVNIAGAVSANVEMNVKDVIYGCTNEGNVSGKKNNIGGIVGFEEVGAVYGCVSYGNVDGADVSYAGGIAGLSYSDILYCCVKSSVTAANHVGGIAGSGKSLETNYAMITLVSDGENLGGIAGEVTDGGSVNGNIYLKTATVAGAIDKISYAGIAESAEYADFISYEDLPDRMKTLTYTFTADGVTVASVDLQYGETIPSDKIPDVPSKDGAAGKWVEFDKTASENLTIEAVYRDNLSTISYTRDGEEKRFILAEGTFNGSSVLNVTEGTRDDYTPRDDETVTGRFTVEIPDDSASHTLRIQGDAYTRIYLQVNGRYTLTDTETDGSYVTFTASGNPVTFTVCEENTIPVKTILTYGGIAAGVIAAAVAVSGIAKAVKKHKSSKQSDSDEKTTYKRN